MKGSLRMNWTQCTDGELVATLASDGADEAFAELVRRHATMVFRTCRRITGSHQDAEDATQAVFATVIVRSRDLAKCRSLGGWLYSAAWHVSRRYRRSELTRRRRERRATPVMPVNGDEHDPELAAELYRAIELLPADYRDAIVLHHLQGCTIQQVAELTGSPVGTAAARLSRARAMLRERLSWRGIMMTDAMITTFVMAELLREPVSESVAARAAMAGAATTATEAASATLVLATCAPAAAPTPIAPPQIGLASVVVAGLKVKHWVSAACVTLVLSSTAAVALSPTDGRMRTRQRESASVEQTNRSAGSREPFLSIQTTSSVPEPSCVGAFAAGGLLLRRNRRRERAD